MSKYMYYMLVGQEVFPCTAQEWLVIFSENDHYKRVGWDKVGNVVISTVFLGIDHNYSFGPPLLFESMIFGGVFDAMMWRYENYQQALEGHDKIVSMVNNMDPNVGRPELEGVIET